YLFTLKDGKFEYFDKGIKTNIVSIETPKIEKKNKRIPTLIPELDKLLDGGFERGTLNIFQIGDKVGISYRNIMNPMFLNLVLQGIVFFYFPFKGISPNRTGKWDISAILNEICTFHLDDEALRCLKKYFYAILYQKDKAINNNLEYNTYIVRGEDLNEDISDFADFATKVLSDTKADTFCVLIPSNTFEFIYGRKELKKAVQSWMNQIRKMNGILIILQTVHEKLIPNYLATSYFKLENIDGNIVLYGEIPRTKMYVTGLDVSNSRVQVRLIPIE
ncbi:MAG: hypothetical protein QXO71_05595, partial [Candidatus Jordarchaeaceae archaeon]